MCTFDEAEHLPIPANDRSGELRRVLLRTLATGAYCCMRWGTDGFVYYSP